MAFGRFFCILVRSGLDFRGLRGTPRMVLEAPRPCISRFSHGRGHALLDMLYVHETPLKLMRNAYRPSSAQRKKTKKVHCGTLSNRVFYKDHAKNSSLGSPGSVLEGSGALLGGSWAPLGRLLRTLGQLLGPLECFLGTSWLVLGASCANLSSQGPPRPRFWRVWERSRLGFEEFGGHNLTYFLLRIALCYLMFF